MTEETNEAIQPQEATSVEDTQVEATNEQAQESSWIESLSDAGLKESKSLSNFKDVEALAKSYVNLEKKLGAPKEPEKYELDDYGYELPEGYQGNNEILDNIKSKAAELGLKPEAFKTLVEEFTSQEQDYVGKLQSEHQAELQKQIDEEAKYLKEKHNLAPKDIIEKSRNAWGSFADERYRDLFNNLDQGTQLVVADMLNNISSRISEGSIGKQETYMLTKQEAQNRMEEIYSNPSYLSGDTATREALGKELMKLQKLAM